MSSVQTKCLVIISIFLMSAMAHARPVEEASLDLRFGAISEGRPVQAVLEYRSFLDKLENKMTRALQNHVTIKMVISRNARESAKNLVKGKIDFVSLDPAMLILVQNEDKGIRPFAFEKNGEGHLKTEALIVRANSDLLSVADLKGKKLLLGQKGSAVGDSMPRVFLLSRQLKALDFSSISYNTTENKRIEELRAGLADGIFVSKKMLDELDPHQKEFRILDSFVTPNQIWAVRSGFSADQYSYLVKIFLGMTDKSVLKKMGISGFDAFDLKDMVRVEEALKMDWAFEE